MAEKLGGTIAFAGGGKTVHRVGYGAMRLSGKHITGPPKDEAEAIRVLKAAMDAGVDHIDTSDFYGPHVTNQIIRKALHPYPSNLTIVTKLGARRGAGGSWLAALAPEDLRAGAEDNLKNLGLDTLEVVNLRVGPPLSPVDFDIEPALTVLLELQREGKIRHIGLSTITPAQYAKGGTMTQVACVQNEYNVVQRKDYAFLDQLAEEGVPYVPYFPLGGFSPLQSHVLEDVAKEAGATPMQVALAWLLQRSPNIALIPGTSSVAHLEENLKAAEIELSAAAVEKLDGLRGAGDAAAH